MDAVKFIENATKSIARLISQKEPNFHQISAISFMAEFVQDNSKYVGEFWDGEDLFDNLVNNNVFEEDELFKILRCCDRYEVVEVVVKGYYCEA